MTYFNPDKIQILTHETNIEPDLCPPRRIEIPNLWYTDGNDEQHNQDAILVQANDCAHATNLTLYKNELFWAGI